MDWVEATGSTVAIAVQAAITELGIIDPEHAVVEVLQEPKPGFLGIGKQQAVVKVSRKPVPKQPRRRGRGGRSGGDGGQGGADTRRGGTSSRQGRQQGGPRSSGSRSDTGGAAKGDLRAGTRQDDGQTAPGGDSRRGERKERTAMDGPQLDEATVAEQAAVAENFIKGLLDAFGLEGNVATRIEDDTVHLDVTGEQTEALVGSKGAVMQAVLEITRTVVQRSTSSAPRMRLDIAGYAERRREALRIYTNKLAERVLADGGEVMLEPMNSADRKVVHDTVAEIAGVRSFSEGEDPDRAVVITPEG